MTILAQNTEALSSASPAEGVNPAAIKQDSLPVKSYRLEKEVDLFKLESTVARLEKDTASLQQELKDLKSNITNGVAFAGLVIAIMIFMLFKKSDS